MSISTTVSWLFRSINECFRFFQGIYFSLGFNIVALIVAGYGVLAVMRMITNGTLSLSKTVDVPRDINPQYNSRYRSDQDPWNPARQYSIFDYDDISKE